MPGWKQVADGRARRRSRTPPMKIEDSWAAAGHLSDWAIGKASAPSIQRHCLNVVRADERKNVRSDKVMKKLSMIGDGLKEVPRTITGIWFGFCRNAGLTSQA